MIESSRDCSIGLEPDKPLGEKCGIVAIYNSTTISRQFETGAIAATALWHRGQQGLGVIVETDHGLEKRVMQGSPEIIFPTLKQEFRNMEGNSNWALFHDRYGTAGDYQSRNLQPINVTTESGDIFSIIHNGEFVINKNLQQQVLPRNHEGASDTYVFAKILQQSSGINRDERVLNALNQVNGAYSLVIGAKDALYAARDEFGIRPMVIGKCGNGWIITSETCALDKLNFELLREIKRGEVIRIDQDGLTTLREGLDGQGNFCDFEWAYFSSPTSASPTHNLDDDAEHDERWLSYYRFRQKCGLILAEEKPIKNADFVIGVPDSGVAVGNGYAAGMNIPFEQVIIRYHYDSNGENNRVFMRDDEREKLSERANGKHALVRDPIIWQDAVVVVVDDSIIRSTVSKALTERIFERGAKEVHFVLGFPPVRYPCHLGVSMRTPEELIANRLNGDEEAIAKEIGATSVGYISPEGFLRARRESGLVIPKDPKDIFLVNGGCGGCVTGRYPIDKEGTIYQKD